MNLDIGIERVCRFTVRVSSTNRWNPSISSIVATGSSSP
jgi:hypothetical protein